ncbi:MAG TPA: aldo/keto reductase [Ktedonobacteraceae bacterium]|nr:aldo/keto reductase [Ktedonobacteraceae bacterium]
MTDAFAFPRRPLGKTGLEVTTLCVGAAPLASMVDTFAYAVSEEQALATIRAVFASPINFIDTAASYGDGESERRLGLALSKMGGVPEGYVLATKADRDLHTGKFDADQVLRSTERSLRLLGMKQVPLLYLHDPEHITYEESMAPGGAVEGMVRCQREGLAAHIGVAGGPIDMMTRYVETGLFEVAISHNRYTLLSREADPFWDVCQRYGVAAVNAAPYGSGILAKGPAAYPRYRYSEAAPEIVERASQMAAICARYEVPLAAAALQFSLRDPRIASTIVGISRPERLAETIELAHSPIPDELWSALAAV